MAQVLVLYASVEGQTALIAGRLAEQLRRRGLFVTLRDARGGVEPLGYQAVIVGASVHYGRHPAWLRAALRRQRDALQARPGAFFSVSLSANPAYASGFLRQVGWRPQLSATFVGALRYSGYGRLKRLMLQGFARLAGHSTDASRDHDYTDWDAVARFADDFAGSLRA